MIESVDTFYGIHIDGKFYYKDPSTRKPAWSDNLNEAQLFHDRRQAVHVCNVNKYDRDSIVIVQVTKQVLL